MLFRSRQPKLSPDDMLTVRRGELTARLAQAQQGLGQGLLGYGQGVSQSLAGLGQMGTQTGLASGQALLGAGTLEQQTQQQLNAALYNQYQQQQGYPFQVAQFLANIAMGTGPLYGSTTSGVTGQPTPFFSDERVKEDITEIGRTHDGQKIIKFKYKGSNQPQIGLSAQDVEKHHPEAVSETPEGIKAVDYDMATEHAERPHAYAGGLMPSSEGGAVHPSTAGLGFASGGTPVPGANPEVDEMLRGLAPRRGFADGGEAELMRKLYPWGAAGGLGGGTPGAGGAWSPGLTVKPQAPLGSGAQLKAPAPRATGLSQTVDAVKGGLGAVDDAKKLYKSGKEGYEWAKDAVGKVRDKLELPDLTKQAEDYAADPNVNPTVARGGRIGYEGGGDVAEDETPAIPGGGDDTVLGKLTAQQVTPAKLPEHKLDMSSDAGGGQKKDGTGKAIGSLAGAGIGAMFGPAGMGVGSTLGGLLGGMFARGGATDIEHAKGLISRVESGGNYSAMGPLVRGDRAHGKYQVMGANIPSWTEEALGRRMTPAEFLKSPEAQERVFEHHFGKYLNQHGNLADAASMWHSGRPLAKARADGARDVNMSTEEYVAKILGGAPPAEAHMRSEAPPPQRSAGLARPVTDVEDLNGTPPFAEPNDDFEMFNNFEMPVRFATGGLVPRRGYQTGGGYLPRRDYLTASEEGIPASISEEDLQRDLQRGLRETPFARPPGLGGLNLPQHQPPMPNAEGPPTSISIPPRSVPPAERTRDDRDLSGYNPPGSVPAAAPAPVSAAPQVAGATRATPGVAPPLQSAEVKPVEVKPADAPPPKQGDRDFFDRAGDWMGRNQNWLLPAVSGIGKMLASPSPYLGVAIGQGLAEGAQTGLGASFKQQGLDTQQQATDASTMAQLQRAYEYAQRMADVERANNNGQVSAATASNLAAIQKQIMAFAGLGSPRSAGRRAQEEPQGGATPAGAPMPSGGTPSTVAGDQTRVGTPVSGGNAPPRGTGAAPAFPDTPRTPITADYTTTESGVPVDKMNNPAYLRTIAATMSTPEERNRYIEMARVIENTGVVTDINGARGIAKGWPEMQRQQQAVASNQEWQRKEADASNERQTIIRSYGLLEKALQQVDTNPAAVVTTNIKEGARALGFVVPDGMSSAAAVQEITKQVAARAAQAGSDRARGMLQDGSIEAIKNPEANKQILAQLYADIDAAESRYRYIDDKIKTTPTGDFSSWQQEWSKANPPNKFQDEAYNRLGVLGATPLDDRGVPDPTRMKVGAIYLLTPDQVWRSTDGRQRPGAPVRMKLIEENGRRRLVEQ